MTMINTYSTDTFLSITANSVELPAVIDIAALDKIVRVVARACCVDVIVSTTGDAGVRTLKKVNKEIIIKHD